MEMNILRLNSQGEDVTLWQHFLIGQGFYTGAASGLFDVNTRNATIKFQQRYRLGADGEVGTFTYGVAEQFGFHSSPYEDEDGPDKHGPNWPPRPDFSPLITNAQLQQLFGKFSYKPAGSMVDPEAIIVTDDWYSKNIVHIDIPQLMGVKGANNGRNLAFHKLVADKVIELFKAWEEANLIPLILSCGGSYAARFVRGHRETLSNHAFGSAFDINVIWNYLGTRPALVGTPGSVRELVPIANEHKFYWGGHYQNNRPDGMHFSVSEL